MFVATAPVEAMQVAKGAEDALLAFVGEAAGLLRSDATGEIAITWPDRGRIVLARETDWIAKAPDGTRFWLKAEAFASLFTAAG